MKPRIAILAPRLDRGDAVGNDALGMWRSLRGLGFDARLFSEGWTVAEDVTHVRRLSGFLQSPDDVLLYHYSIAWPTALALFLFEPYHEGIANSCRGGIHMIRDFAGAGVALWLTPSHFNKTELMMHDIQEAAVKVVPIFHRIPDLLAREPHLYTIDQLRRKKSGPAFLTLGRVAPNKSLAYLIQEFALFREKAGAGSLWLVGKKVPPLIRYTQELNALVHAHGLASHVHFVGPVNESMLKALYVSADAYVTASEHEGFCVPLVESMALRLPVLAARQAAVAETLGNAGVLVDRGPGILAHAMDGVAQTCGTVHPASRAGEERYHEAFAPPVVDNVFHQALIGVLPVSSVEAA
ncbi:MAG: glycosyltransferase [Spirochaetia bacterium]|nr:glycosyltransferase [Spirochaetia bacterium]